VADEFDEWLPHGLTDHAVGCDNVRHAEKREKYADPNDFQHLEEQVLPPESRQALVPDRCE